MDYSQQRPDPDDIEPLVNTDILDTWAEAELPLRGRVRQRVLDKTRMEIKQRRTVDGVAARLSNLAVSPVTNAMRQEAEEEARQAIERFLERRTKDE